MYVEDKPELVGDCVGEGWGCVFLIFDFCRVFFFLSLLLRFVFVVFFLCVPFIRRHRRARFLPLPHSWKESPSWYFPPRLSALAPTHVFPFWEPHFFFIRVLDNACILGLALPEGDSWVVWVLLPWAVWRLGGVFI
jgi:hypothetical protein